MGFPSAGAPAAAGAPMHWDSLPSGGLEMKAVEALLLAARGGFAAEKLQQAAEALRRLSSEEQLHSEGHLVQPQRGPPPSYPWCCCLLCKLTAANGARHQGEDGGPAENQPDVAAACKAFCKSLQRHLFAAFSLDSAYAAGGAGAADPAAATPRKTEGPPSLVTLEPSCCSCCSRRRWCCFCFSCPSRKVVVDASLLQRRVTPELLQLLVGLLSFPRLLRWVAEAFSYVALCLQLLLLLQTSAARVGAAANAAATEASGTEASPTEGGPWRAPSSVCPPLLAEVLLHKTPSEALPQQGEEGRSRNGSSGSICSSRHPEIIMWRADKIDFAPLSPLSPKVAAAAAAFLSGSVGGFSDAAIAAALTAEEMRTAGAAASTATTTAATATAATAAAEEDWAALCLRVAVASWLTSVPLLSSLAVAPAPQQALYTAIETFLTAGAAAAAKTPGQRALLCSLKQFSDARIPWHRALTAAANAPDVTQQQQLLIQLLQDPLQQQAPLQLLFAAAAAPAPAHSIGSPLLLRLQQEVSEGLAAGMALSVASLAAAASGGLRSGGSASQPHQELPSALWLLGVAAAEALPCSTRNSIEGSKYTAPPVPMAGDVSAHLQSQQQQQQQRDGLAAACCRVGTSCNGSFSPLLCHLLLQRCAETAESLCSCSSINGSPGPPPPPVPYHHHPHHQQQQQSPDWMLNLQRCRQIHFAAQQLHRLLTNGAVCSKCLVTCGSDELQANQQRYHQRQQHLQQHHHQPYQQPPHHHQQHQQQQQQQQQLSAVALLPRIAASFYGILRMTEMSLGASPEFQSSLWGPPPQRPPPQAAAHQIYPLPSGGPSFLLEPRAAMEWVRMLEALKAFLSAATRGAPPSSLLQLRAALLAAAASASPDTSAAAASPRSRKPGLSLYLNLIIEGASEPRQTPSAASTKTPHSGQLQPHHHPHHQVLLLQQQQQQEQQQEQLMLQELALQALEETAVDFPLSVSVNAGWEAPPPLHYQLQQQHFQRLSSQQQQQTIHQLLHSWGNALKELRLETVALWFVAAAAAGSSSSNLPQGSNASAARVAAAEGHRQLLQRLLLWSSCGHPSLSSIAVRCWQHISTMAAGCHSLQQQQQQQQQQQMQAAAARACAMLFAVATRPARDASGHIRVGAAAGGPNDEGGLQQLCAGAALQLSPSEQQVRLFCCFAAAANAAVAAVLPPQQQRQQQQLPPSFAEELLQLPLQYGAALLNQLGGSESSSSSSRAPVAASLPMWLSMVAPLSAAALQFPVRGAAGGPPAAAAETLANCCHLILEALLDVTHKATAAGAEGPGLLQQPPLHDGTAAGATAAAAAVKLLLQHPSEGPVPMRCVDSERAAVVAVCHALEAYALLALSPPGAVLVPFAEELCQFLEHYLCSPSMAAASPLLFGAAVLLSCCWSVPNAQQQQPLQAEAAAATARMQQVVQKALPQMLVLHPVKTAESIFRAFEISAPRHLLQGITAAFQQPQGHRELLLLLRAITNTLPEQQHHLQQQQQHQLGLTAAQQQQVASLLNGIRLRGYGHGDAHHRSPTPIPVAAAGPIAVPAGVADAGARADGLGGDVRSFISRRLLSLLPVAPSAAAAQDIHDCLKLLTRS